MIQLTLNRDYFTSYCILGVLSEPGGRKWFTVEKPWVASSGHLCGDKGQSCVPLGDYKIYPYTSDAHVNVWALSAPMLDVCIGEDDVPPHKRGIARTRCLIHPANWASELRGCIAPGKERAKENGTWMVKRSRDAINELRGILNGNMDIRLSISSGGSAP